MKKPENVLVYYGYPNSFNSNLHSWNNEKIAQDMARYEHVVLGAGLEDPGHADHSNTQTIADRLHELNCNLKLWGYVDATDSVSSFENKVEKWNENIGVEGIFMDKCGYDFGLKRAELNERLDLVHSWDNLAFVNAWNLNHVLGVSGDASYPNSTYNPYEVESNIQSTDWMLLENYGVLNNDYESESQWAERLQRVQVLRQDYDVNMAAVSQIYESNQNAQDLFDFLYYSAVMSGLEGVGSGDQYWGGSSAKTSMWKRPSVSGCNCRNVELLSGSLYGLYCPEKRLLLDFADGSESVSAEIY